MNKPFTLADLKLQKEKAMQVVAKYNTDLAELYSAGTKEDIHTVMIYFANEANHQQRVVAGLDKE